MKARRGTAESYRVFVRNWWRYAEPGEAGTEGGKLGLPTSRKVVPDPGARKTTLATGCTWAEARALCEEYAASHDPGPLSRKAEFESE